MTTKTKTLNNGVTFDLYTPEEALSIMEDLCPLTNARRELILQGTAEASRQLGFHWYDKSLFLICAWQEEGGWLIAKGIVGLGFKIWRHDDEARKPFTHAYMKAAPGKKESK